MSAAAHDTHGHSHGHGHDDFAVEPIPGLPERPPEGEHILWQGAPEWRGLARHAFHTRKIAVYAGLLLSWHSVTAVYDGASLGAALLSVAGAVPLAAAAVGLPALLAWLTARSTIYTVTSKRVVIRGGVALPLTVNLPFEKIDAAALKRHRDGSGDIALTLKGKDRIAYLALWPNVRPWRLARPEPMLRCLAAPEAAAGLLARALVSAHAESGLRPVGSRPQAVDMKTGDTLAPAARQRAAS